MVDVLKVDVLEVVQMGRPAKIRMGRVGEGDWEEGSKKYFIV